mmetsp:Transcript_9828/g.22793  ORF Transcript_9828/g.22793 Transcript_9828/m.22793 type:complete len:205 (+) Transcript_9828:1620-2234(+)
MREARERRQRKEGVRTRSSRASGMCARRSGDSIPCPLTSTHPRPTSSRSSSRATPHRVLSSTPSRASKHAHRFFLMKTSNVRAPETMPQPLLAPEERGADRMMLTRSSLRAVCCDGRRRGRNDNERRDTAARQNKRRRCHGSSISGQASHCKRKGAASPEAVSKSVMSGSTCRSQPWPPICPAQSPPPPVALRRQPAAPRQPRP